MTFFAIRKNETKTTLFLPFLIGLNCKHKVYPILVRCRPEDPLQPRTRRPRRAQEGRGAAARAEPCRRSGAAPCAAWAADPAPREISGGRSDAGRSPRCNQPDLTGDPRRRPGREDPLQQAPGGPQSSWWCRQLRPSPDHAGDPKPHRVRPGPRCRRPGRSTME